MREAGFGPKRQFAAAQRDACNGSKSGRSADVAGAAAPDRNALPDDSDIGIYETWGRLLDFDSGGADDLCPFFRVFGDKFRKFTQ
jgi:hypothetical protein